MKGISPESRSLLQQPVREAFDSVADSFDETFENPITRGLRERLYTLMSELIPQGSSILDINCGTGIDAIELSKRGFTVVGTDLSPRMIEQARTKTRRLGSQNTSFHVSSFESVSQTIDQKFDLVLSNFGGLNCVQNLRPVFSEVAVILKPGGFFVAVVMPKASPWHVFASIARGNLRSATLRFRTDVKATGFSGNTFPVFYHSLSSLRDVAFPSFSLQKAWGVNIVSPPPHARTFLQQFPKFSMMMEAVERRCSSWPILRSVGDHFIALLVKREVTDHA